VSSSGAAEGFVAGHGADGRRAGVVEDPGVPLAAAPGATGANIWMDARRYVLRDLGLDTREGSWGVLVDWWIRPPLGRPWTPRLRMGGQELHEGWATSSIFRGPGVGYRQGCGQRRGRLDLAGTGQRADRRPGSRAEPPRQRSASPRPATVWSRKRSRAAVIERSGPGPGTAGGPA
jgi:hypothetical protein